MKKILLAVLMTIPLISFAQKFNFYLNGRDLEFNTFKLGDGSQNLKVSFSNTTKFKFRISSVLVIVGVPIPAQGPMQQAYSGVDIKKDIVTNPPGKFKKDATFTFDLRKIIGKYPNPDCTFSFKVNEFVSDSDDGNSWIQQHLLFNEVAIKKSISTNPKLAGKGDH